MEEIKAFLNPRYNCQNIDPYYLFEHIGEFDITKITLDYKINYPEIKISFNDENNPVTYTNNISAKSTLSISSSYYEKHKDLIDKLIIEICKKSKLSSMALLDTRIIDEKKLDTLRDNENIQNITLGKKVDIFSLDTNTYNKFKGLKHSIITHAVDNELQDNFDPMIFYNTHRELVNGWSYDSLSTLSELHINRSLSKEEIENLKYLNPQAKVKIKFDNTPQFIEIINRFRELNQERDIVITVENKNKFTRVLLKYLSHLKDFKNIRVSIPNLANPVNLETYLKYEKELIRMIAPAVNLSPFEKYLYAYNIAKQFKDYKENPDDLNSSRKLYKILDNEYMVCVGFSHLLGDLLDKLNIENNYYSVKVETGYNGLKNDIMVLPNEVINKKTGKKREILPVPGSHARREVHLVDPKYGIDGYFIADPTWDNILDHDSYIYALMTGDEFTSTNRYNYINIKNSDELFFVHSIEEFYQKLNFLLNKNPTKPLESFIRDLISHIKNIDISFYHMIISKYKINETKPLNQPFEVEQEILLDIGNHIINKTNNMVNRNQFKQGITTIYSMIYDTTMVDIESLVEETLEYNRKRQEEKFPKRIKIDKDGNSSIDLNEYNKFAMEESPDTKIAL